jgi:cephalosporin hydroxylase
MHTLQEFKDIWQDEPDRHLSIHEEFCRFVNAISELKRHRDFVQERGWGYGERSFGWMWWLIIQELPYNFTFLEIGVYKGQILSLVPLIARMQSKVAKCYGITPLITETYKDIAKIHRLFNLHEDYTILRGLSTNAEIIAQAQKLSLDILYIDGGHDYGTVTSDLQHYTPLLKQGGYLVCDDACNDMSMPPNMFRGHDETYQAVRDFFKEDKQFTFIGNVVHNRIFQKNK